MPQVTTEDKDDVFIENLNTALFLFLGILAVFASLVLFVNLAVAAVYGQQFPTNPLGTSILAAMLFVIGSGSLHLFRDRREQRKRKASQLFLRSNVTS